MRIPCQDQGQLQSRGKGRTTLLEELLLLATEVEEETDSGDDKQRCSLRSKDLTNCCQLRLAKTVQHKETHPDGRPVPRTRGCLLCRVRIRRVCSPWMRAAARGQRA